METHIRLKFSGMCSICCEQIMNKNKRRVLTCKHAFHEDCVAKWLGNTDLCPNCRDPQLSKEFQDSKTERILTHNAQLDQLIHEMIAISILTRISEGRREYQNPLRQIEFRVRNPLNEMRLSLC